MVRVPRVLHAPPPLPHSWADGVGRRLQGEDEGVLCTRCAAGTYQKEMGASGCDECTPGYYCPEGAATPIPCRGGTYGPSAGLASPEQCVDVVFDEWAPTGASAPERCFTGFYCPGRHDDKVNDPPGSKPIQVDSGGSTTKKAAVRSGATHHPRILARPLRRAPLRSLRCACYRCARRWRCR